MSTSSSRIAGIALTLLLFLVAGTVWRGSSGFPMGDAAQPDGSRLKDLLTKRLGTLQEFAAFCEMQARDGKSIERAFQARRAALMAELEMADNEKERMGLLEKIVAAAEKQEENALRLKKGGQLAHGDVLPLTVSRLEAEIALEKAKATK